MRLTQRSPCISLIQTTTIRSTDNFVFIFRNLYPPGFQPENLCLASRRWRWNKNYESSTVYLSWWIPGKSLESHITFHRDKQITTKQIDKQSCIPDMHFSAHRNQPGRKKHKSKTPLTCDIYLLCKNHADHFPNAMAANNWRRFFSSETFQTQDNRWWHFWYMTASWRYLWREKDLWSFAALGKPNDFDTIDCLHVF